MDEAGMSARGEGVISRRDALRRGGVVVGAAALWSTPAVRFVGTAHASTSSPQPNADLCPGQPSGLEFAYLPNVKGFFDFGPGYVPSGDGMENEPIFTTDSDDLVGNAVKIEFWANNQGLEADGSGGGGNGNGNGNGGGGGGPDRVFLPSDSQETGGNLSRTLPVGGLPSGGTFFSGDLHPNGKAGPNNAFRITDEFGNVQFFTFHTSCSKDLETGFVFGSIKVVDGVA